MGNSASAVINSGNGAPLININNDCLHEISQYLNIYDVACVATTCKKLSLFANNVVFPKMANQILIRIDQGIQQLNSERTVNDLIPHFRVFGKHVKKLTLVGVEDIARNSRYLRINSECLRKFKIIIEHCPNLDELCLDKFMFDRMDYVLPPISQSLKLETVSESQKIGQTHLRIFRNLQIFLLMMITCMAISIKTSEICPV